jgi:hypothetical protein
VTTFDPKIDPSEYERLINEESLYTRGRRSTLTDEERTKRRRAQSRFAMETRRRAVSVLINRHRQEYDELYDAERRALELDPRYQLD